MNYSYYLNLLIYYLLLYNKHPKTFNNVNYSGRNYCNSRKG